MEGFEVVIEITGTGVKNITILLYSISGEEQKTKGKARLTNMLRSGKELKVFTVRNGNLKKFTQEIRKYDVLYCILADRGNKNPNAEADVIARAEDTSEINHIVEHFSLASVGAASIVTEAEKSKEAKGELKNAKTAEEKGTGVKDSQPEPDVGVEGKVEKSRLMDALMGKLVKKEENAPNPSLAKTKKFPLSEPTLKQQGKSAEGATMTRAEKPSAREELRKIKEGRRKQGADVSPAKEKSSDKAKKSPAGKTEHKQPQKRKHRPESRGER